MVGNEGIRCAKRFCVQCGEMHWHHVHETLDGNGKWYTCWACGINYMERDFESERVEDEEENKTVAQSCDDRLCDGHCDRCWYV